MSSRRGFTLTELLVYVLLFGFSAYVMIASSTLLQQWCSWVTEQRSGHLQHLLLGDVIMRDVVAASHDSGHWSAAAGVFRKQFLNRNNRPVSYDVGYTCSAGQCLRVQGVFDYQAQRWQQQQYSVLAQIPLKNIVVEPIVVASDKQQATVTHARVCLVGCNGAIKAQTTYRVRSRVVPYAG